MNDAFEMVTNKQHPVDRPIIRIEFRTASQGVLRLELTLKDLQVEGGHPAERLLRGGPPVWLTNPSRSGWDHPQDPFVFKGTVKSGHEAEARAALGLEEA